MSARTARGRSARAPALARGLAVAALSSFVALALVASACTDGVTPDCSGANAEKCGPSLSLDAAGEASSLVVPEASTPASDGGDAGDASARDGRDGRADGGDGG